LSGLTDEALLQYSKINELPPADEFNVNNLRTWLMDPGLGDCHVQGPGQNSWGDLSDPNTRVKPFREHLIHFLRSLTILWAEKPPTNEHPELVVPRKLKEIDGFTHWIANDCRLFGEKSFSIIQCFMIFSQGPYLNLPSHLHQAIANSPFIQGYPFGTVLKACCSMAKEILRRMKKTYP
jgi:hypothetical protein